MSFKCRRVYLGLQSTLDVRETPELRDHWLEYNSLFRAGTAKFIDGVLVDGGISAQDAEFIAAAQKLADADKPVTVGDVKINTRHLCGGWFKCPGCPRIYCACSGPRCYTCGMPLSQRSDLFVENPDAEIAKSGGKSEVS